VRGRALLLTALTFVAHAAPAFERTEQRAPCAEHDPLRRPFFGDTHVHTALSFDAMAQGTRNGPAEAYAFARGEPLGVQPYDADDRPLRRLRLRQALDFAIVTDHAEMFGEVHVCASPGSAGHGSIVCRIIRRWPWLAYHFVNQQMFDVARPRRYPFCGPGGARCIEAALGPWTEVQDAAEAAYDRTSACRFTSFVGYEWTGNPDGYMVHRNVIFRNERVPRLPATYVEHPTPESLWDALETDCRRRGDGCDVLSVPHNSNLGGGLLFATPADAAAARRRADFEPLLEVTQHKGDSECRGDGPLGDPECGFETLAFGRMRESAMPWAVTAPPDRSFAREVLAAGVAEHRRLGVNPFALGLIGSTDTHLGTPGLVDEDAFIGHAAGRVTHRTAVPPLPDDARMNPGGLVGLWAEENSRDALFAAMRRREAFGTSGPRIVVRFFGGWSQPRDLCARPDLAARGYAGGVPMGGVLAGRGRPENAVPVLVASAQRDPGTADRPGTALERLQVVKVWTDADGPRARVYDVAGRAEAGDADRVTCRPAPGGADHLCAVWRDPEFSADTHAAYYVRVLERPSCRWTGHACAAAAVDCPTRVPRGLEACCDPAVPWTIRERAWTSPIWFVPDSGA
jgi:hypothetical protein